MCVHERMYVEDGRGEVSRRRNEETDHIGSGRPQWRSLDFQAMDATGGF